MATRYDATGIEGEFEPGSNDEVLRNLVGITSVDDMNDLYTEVMGKLRKREEEKERLSRENEELNAELDKTKQSLKELQAANGELREKLRMLRKKPSQDEVVTKNDPAKTPEDYDPTNRNHTVKVLKFFKHSKFSALHLYLIQSKSKCISFKV